MKEPKVIGFYGYSGTGKTTLIERICRDLADREISFAVIKQSDKAIRMDQPGKDTFRFQDAGAGVVALASRSETDLIINRAMSIPEVISLIKSAGDINLVIVESCSDPSIAKIRLGEIEERENTIWTYDNDYQKLLDLIIPY
ncbi:MAG: molybdopterin-guanine dinucleotide biosynthesis protein B [Chloroflexi bacterium]|nr:molybdopterin-guanine dinucleotide biosynthesis protein B [Chloroflexota bacterium]